MQLMNKSEIWGKAEIFSSDDLERAEDFAKILVGYIVQGMEHEENLRLFGEALALREEWGWRQKNRQVRTQIAHDMRQRDADEAAFRRWVLNSNLMHAQQAKDKWQIMAWTLALDLSGRDQELYFEHQEYVKEQQEDTLINPLWHKVLGGHQDSVVEFEFDNQLGDPNDPDEMYFMG